MTEAAENSRMNDQTRENITRSGIWLRLIYMIVLAIAFNVAEIVTFVVVLFQFLTSLFTGRPNDRLARFGQNMARYLQQIVIFLTFATEEKPFPFAPWPDELVGGNPAERDDGNARSEEQSPSADT